MSYNKKVISAVLAVLMILNTALPVAAQNSLLSPDGITSEQLNIEDGTAVTSSSEESVSSEGTVNEENADAVTADTDSEEVEPTSVPVDLSGSTEPADESSEAEPAVTADSSDGLPADDSSAAVDAENVLVPDDSSVAADAEKELLPDDSSEASLVEEPATASEEVVGAAALSDGTYYIYTPQATPYMMCLKGNGTGDNVNIQLGSFTASNVRIFCIESTGDGYYYIRSYHSSKYLTVGTKNNVQQNTLKSGSSGQKWFISRNSDGSYQILTADKKQKLTAASNKTGANISVNAATTGIQSWKIRSTKPYIAGGMVTYTYEKGVEKAEDGTVIPPTVTVNLYGKTLVENVDYTVTNTIGTTSGTLTLQGIGNYSGSKKLTYTIYTYLLSEGCYHIYANSSAAKPMFSIRGNTDGNLGNAQLGTYAASNVRLFEFKRANQGYYYIRNVHTNKYLTAEGTWENANVSQFTFKGNAAQQWKLTFYGHTYRLISRSAKKYLIAPKAKVGANLQLCSTYKYQYAWTIVPAKKYISGGMVTYDYEGSVPYDPNTGAYVQPEVTVTLYDTVLQEGVDFTVTYSIYPDKGIGKAVLKGIGDYTGTKVLTYLLEEEEEKTYPALPTEVETYQSDYRFDWVFKLDNTATKLYMTREGYHATITNCSSCVMCDMSERKLYIMKGYRSFAINDMQTLKWASFQDITPKVGEIYTLRMQRSDTFSTTLTLIENSSGKSVSLTDRTYDAGRGWGTTNTYVVGSATNIHLKGYSTKMGDGVLGIMGDSYTEGATLRDDYTCRYATLLDHAFDNNVIITAKAAANSAQGLKWLREYLKDLAKPKYMIVEFGMNDTSFDVWQKNMTSIIGILESNGITPILATIPPISSRNSTLNEVHREMSKWIMKSGYMYLDFEYVMSENHDRVTYDSTKLLADGVHPTVEVHKEVANIFLKKYKTKISIS